MDSAELLTETTLPKREDLYDTLHQERINLDEYKRSRKIWHNLNCETLWDYSDVYLKSDHLLLAGIFEIVRTLCLQT